MRPTPIFSPKFSLLACMLSVTSVSLTGFQALAQTQTAPPTDTGAYGKVESAAKEGVEKAETAVFDAIDKKTLTVDFGKGAAKLDAGELRSLRSLVAAQDTPSSKMKVYVAAWPDSIVSESKPDKSSVKLSDNRLAAIKKALDRAKFKGEIVAINMAKEPTLVDKLFSTDAGEVKSAASEGNSNVSAQHARIAENLRTKGGEGKSVIVLTSDTQ